MKEGKCPKDSHRTLQEDRANLNLQIPHTEHKIGATGTSVTGSASSLAIGEHEAAANYFLSQPHALTIFGALAMARHTLVLNADWLMTI